MKSSQKKFFFFTIVISLTLILFFFQNLMVGQSDNNDQSLWHYIGWGWLHFNQPIMIGFADNKPCLLYTSPSPRDRQKSRMPSSA